MWKTKQKEGEYQGLEHYLSPLMVWALSFGCAVGWGSFVMPGTTFLPAAGPMGTFLGILVGAVVMFIIGMNYHFLMNEYPDAGGTLTYTIKSFGYDHGFLSAWFLMLVYIAIMWANASALSLISKNLLGATFQFGFHYVILGYDVYFGEVLLSLAAIIICGSICILGKRLAAGLQVLLALILFFGVMICALTVFQASGGAFTIRPAFSPSEEAPFRQILSIVALSPWAFVGFESVSNSAAGFRFDRKRVIRILTSSLITGSMVYLLLTQMAASVTPAGYEDWSSYIADLGSFSGISGLPTFYAAEQIMGKTGVILLGLAALAGILTGLIGNFIAASRLMYTMSEDGMLPKQFHKLNQDHTPRNALLFLMIISLFIPFLGRTAIGWIVDVNTVGATIAYGYTSAAAFHTARKKQKKGIMATGLIGLAMSLFFFLYFMAWAAGAMSTESYLILAIWSVLGFLYFRYVFSKDDKRRFGKSTVVWIGLLFLIFFTSLMWVKNATDEMTENVVTNISTYYESQHHDHDAAMIDQTQAFLVDQLDAADRVLVRNSVIQMLFIIVSLGIMFSVYITISKREKQMEIEKIKAEESSKAKMTFLSKMSHDIRTPMNAIIGYINLSEREDITLDEMKENLAKIKGSSKYLLALINDVLEMSRIESGKMELEPVVVDLKKRLCDVKDLYQTLMEEKRIEFQVDCSEIQDPLVYCDINRFNRVLLNLISNAYKYTPEGGRVSVSARQLASEEPDKGRYEILISDSGIGMSDEFAAKIFEPFEREQTSAVKDIQGTGLGMSITKNILDLMGGEISVQSKKQEGTVFRILIAFPLAKEAPSDAKEKPSENEPAEEMDFSSKRLLLVDDMEINREIAAVQLRSKGFTLDFAKNGQEAVDLVTASLPGYYSAVLMDIQMPVMDGYEATKAIRQIPDEALSSIPIIAMTANAFSEDVKKTHDAGMNAHIAKPVDLNVVLEVLGEVMRGENLR